MAVADAAPPAGVSVALVEQPYRVAGRRSAPPAPQLDEAWMAVRGGDRRRRRSPGLPLASGGRSSGARVACRTAAATGVIGVLCLAFPLHPPQRDPAAERKTRLPELEAVPSRYSSSKVTRPLRHATGRPNPPPSSRFRAARSLKTGLGGVGPAVSSWLANTLP